jgi:Zn-dependent peptidase ImmA (M78 family)
MVNVNSFIEQKSERLLIDSKCYSAPIKIEDCAKYLGIKLEALELDDDVAGFLLLKDSNTVNIGYNKNNAPQRRRFTIAHEIAHYILHANDSKIFVDKEEKLLYRDGKSSTGELVKEREANAFAAALLMPQKLLIEEVEKHKLETKEKFISSLAKTFKVSEQAITIRLTNLGLIDYSAFAS